MWVPADIGVLENEKMVRSTKTAVKKENVDLKKCFFSLNLEKCSLWRMYLVQWQQLWKRERERYKSEPFIISEQSLNPFTPLEKAGRGQKKESPLLD